MSPLISPAELARELAADAPVRVLDVQYTLDGRGPALYAAAHLPQAPHCDLDAVLAGPPGRRGRHPLPDPTVLEEGLRALGVGEGQPVVVYDQGNSLGAARAWWVLRWAGLTNVRVLDGGLTAWREAGWEVSADPVTVSAGERGDVTVHPGSVPVLDADGAAALARDGILLDARAAERFRGETEPIDAVAGHIPGARNAPMADYVDDHGRFRSAADLRAYFAGLGVDGSQPVGTTCGSGVTAAHTALALQIAGVDATPYIGSWSEWITDPSRPVATGEPASRQNQ